MNEMMSKRRIQITDLQKQEIEEKQEIRLLMTFPLNHWSYGIILEQRLTFPFPFVHHQSHDWLNFPES